MYPEAEANRAHYTQAAARADCIQGRWADRGRTGRNGPNTTVKCGIQGIQRGGWPSYAEREDKGGVLIDEKAWAIIKAIIQKGNDAVVRKKGDGYIVLEDKREIKFQAKETRPG